MPSSITNTISNGIGLGAGYSSPLTVTGSGFVNAGTSFYYGAAVYASAAAVLTLVNQGRISIAGTGVAVFEGTDLGLTLDNSGTIGAVADAVSLQHDGPITNSGTILSTGATAIKGNIALQVTNATGGLISGYDNGIKAASGTITNYGTIQGTATTANAVYLNGGGNDGIVSNYGLLSATYNGIEFRDSGTLSNSGTIASTGRYGVRFDGATANITNSGTITGTNNALKAFGDGTLSNTGHIVGLNGVAILGSASIGNAGTIEATYGTGVLLGSAGAISNAAAGVITATGYTGINVAGGTATITNKGTISGYTGIDFTGAGASSQTVIDSGTIIGSGGAAIVFAAGNDLLQLQPGNAFIQGNVDGGGGTNTLEFASAASAGTLTGSGADFVNFQTIEVDANASWLLAGGDTFGSTVSLAAGASLTIAGNVVANIYGDPAAAPLTVTSTGSLSNGGAGAAIYFFSGSVVNDGTITAGGATSNDVGVRFRGAGSLVNNGTLTGHYGVLSFGYLNASNTGVIGTSGSRNGVFLRGGGSLTNSGAITGSVGISGPILSLAVYINNSGTVSGSDGIALNAGNTAAATIVDSGTIIGSAGPAVQFSGGDDLLLLQPSTSAFIEGVVDGGAGTNTLEFASAATTGTLTGLGAEFLNFSQGTIDSGASWVLAGSNTFGAGVTLTDSGTLTVAGTLTNAGSLIVDPPITVTGTMINSSVVSAPGTYAAFSLASGGVLTNTASGIVTAAYAGVIGGGGTASVVNLGTIEAPTSSAGYGVSLGAGGTIINGAVGTTAALISAAQGADIASGLISNYGTIAGGPVTGTGAKLRGSSQISNHASGLITGYRGIVLYGVAQTVTNLGVVSATSIGVFANYAGELVTNGTAVGSTALIEGTGSFGVGLNLVAPGLASETLVNYGTISGSYGVVSTVNNATGTLNATIVDAGTIIGTSGAAVAVSNFGAGLSLTLKFVAAGHAFIQGAVFGESGGTGVLEFASGATTGTLTGNQADFESFNTASVDAGASWVLAGTNTFGSGVTLTDAGTLTNSGTLALIGSLTNSATLINTGLIDTYAYALNLSPGSYLRNAATGTIALAGGATSVSNPTVFGLAGGAATIANLGTITNTAGVGIDLQGGGTIVNGAAGTTVSSATIYGLYYGINVQNDPATVTNYGVIDSGTCGCSTYDGVHLGAGGGVTNARFGTISGYLAGVFINGTAGSVSNAGTIVGNGGYGAGVYLNRGGNVTNDLTGQILGYEFGVVVYRAAGTVTNLGTIGGPGRYGVGLRRGGVVVNGASGTSSSYIYGGSVGVIAKINPGTVTNFGTIDGNVAGIVLVAGGTVSNSGQIVSSGTYGVYLGHGGVVTNAAAGQIARGTYGVAITGGVGTVANYGSIFGADVAVRLDAGGTVIDAGSIVATAAGSIAMTFGLSGGYGGSNNLLVLERGFTIGGAISASGTGNVVELLGTSSANAVTATYNSLGLTGFGTIAFAPGAGNYATLKITNNTTLPGTITNFVGLHDAVDLTALSDAGNDATTSFNTLTNVLTVTGDNGSVQLQLGSGSYAGITWLAQNDGSNGTEITPQAIVSPVIAGTRAGQTVSDHATATPFSTATITDANPPLQVETITITLSSSGIPTDADGTLSGTGLSKTGTGTYSITANGPAVATSELQALVFTPTIHQVPPGGTVTTGFALAVTDSLSRSASDSTTTVIATAVADLPVISGTLANQGVPNQTTSAPFSKASVSDPSFGATDSVSVTLSAPGNGTLSNLSGGSYNAATGVFTISGTPAAVTAALNALMFTPSAPSTGYVNTTGFTIAATNQGGTSSDSTTNVTSVQQVLGLAAVPLSQIIISVTADGVGFAAATAGMTNEAVVRGPVTGGIYTLPSGYQAGFLGGTASATLTDASVGNALLVSNEGNDSITAAAGNDTILAGSGNDTLVGGTGNIAIQAGSGNDLIYSLNASNFNITTGSGNDTISAAGAGTVFGGTGSNVLYGAGNATIVSAGARDTVAVLSGTMVMQANGNGALAFGSFNTGGTTLTVAIAGANATVSGGQSTTNVTTGGSNALVFGGFGAGAGGLSVVDSGANTTVSAGDSNSAITLRGSNALVFGRFGDAPGNVQVLDAGRGDTISTGNSTATITAGNNGLLVFGGSGTLNFIGAAGGATVAAGSGATSVTGGSGGTTLFGSAGNALTLLGNSAGVLYAAGAGSESFDARASTVADTLVGGTDVNGANTILGGLGNDTLFAGAGAETLGGGGGADLFSFVASLTHGSADVVTDFASDDLVYFSGYGAAQASIALSNAVSSGGNTTLTLSDNTRITFLNVSSVGALQGHVFSS